MGEPKMESSNRLIETILSRRVEDVPLPCHQHLSRHRQGCPRPLPYCVIAAGGQGQNPSTSFYLLVVEGNAIGNDSVGVSPHGRLPKDLHGKPPNPLVTGGQPEQKGHQVGRRFQ